MRRARFLPLLLLLFIGSGCAALIYEIVWLQLLQLVMGSTAVSMAVLLGTFMAGMCIGSLGLARVVSARANPLRVYAVLELMSAAFGVAVLYGLPLVSGMPRVIASAVCLLAPTIVMGATLPAIARWVRGPFVGALYGANIIGGVLGCVAAGFWLLRVFDMAVASYVAVGINLCLAASAFTASLFATATTAGHEAIAGYGSRDWGVYIAIGLSGFSALGAEAVWTRLLSLTLGPTVYTFSIILAVFLLGMGIGSWTVSSVRRDPGQSRAMLGASQAGLIFAIAWAAWAIASWLPNWDKNLAPTANPWMIFLFDFGCCAVAILPAAILWGASFPLALGSRSETQGSDAAQGVGEIYAANTLGAIAGAIGISILAVPNLGSGGAERLLIAAATAGALALFRRRAAILAIAVVSAWLVPATPWPLLAFGRRMPLEYGRTGNGWKRLYSAEGLNASIAYTEGVDKRRYFHVAGKIEASSTPSDMKVQRVLGHLPGLLHRAPKSVLIVGCGAGVTAGSFVVHPEVANITLCEIEPLIPPASARFFARENHDVVNDSRTHIVYDDARHYVLTGKEKFDIITSDPIHPWVKGAATLYSKEYFEACRAHLNRNGLVTQWVPLYESDLATVQSEIATFFEVFPDGIVWGNSGEFNQGYDVVLMGSTEPIRIDLDALQTKLDGAPKLAESLREVGFHSAAELMGTYGARARELREWLARAQINRDLGLRLQYLAGLALNRGNAGSIYGQIEARGPFPSDLFRGSDAQIEAVRRSFHEWRSDAF